MRVINIAVDDMPRASWPVLLGVRGENDVTEVVFDYNAWAQGFGPGVVQLYVIRAGDAAAYPVVLSNRDGAAVWTVSAVDTAKDGVGKAEFVYRVGDQVAKTCIFTISVGPSIDGSPVDPPDPYESWLNTLAALGSETEQNVHDAEAAQAAAETAQDKAEDAQAAAETAQGKAEDAQAAAETAQDKAEDAQAAAETAQDKAEDAQAAAETAQDKAEDAQAAAETAAEHYPVIVNDYWYVWDVSSNQYVNTGVKAKGESGTGAVNSVNGQTGTVLLDAEDVGALPANADLDDIPDGTTYKRATAAQIAQIGTNASNISAINGKIPLAASASNQLADKVFVTDSITQGTAIYRGSYQSRTALLAVAWQTTDPNAANYVSNNDYAYVLDDETHDDECWRYLYVTGTGWTAQVRINESPLTQAQLDALNSGATAEIIASVSGKYVKPSGGIPDSDLSSEVQSSLNKADSALQSVPNTYRTAAAQDLIDEGKQAEVTVSGILKGDGNGNVSAAIAGTDYATPEQIPTVPSAYTSDPAMDGTASPGSSGSWAKGDHVHPTHTGIVQAYDRTTHNGASVTIDGYSNDIVLYELIANLDTDQQGSGTPSISNPRTILERTKSIIQVKTKNLCLITAKALETPQWISAAQNKGMLLYGNNGVQSTRDRGQGAWGGFITHLNAGTYTISSRIREVTPGQARIDILYTTDGVTSTPLVSDSVMSVNNGVASYTFTLPANADVKIALFGQYGPVFWNEIQIEQGSSPTFYVTPTQSYSIEWPNVSGVYAGSVDVTRGKLIVTHRCKVYNSSSGWIVTNGGEIVRHEADMQSGSDANMRSNMFFIGSGDGGLQITNAYANLRIKPATAMTISDWGTLLSNTPLQVVYLLPEPEEYDIIAMPIYTAKSAFTISADSGDIYAEYGAFIQSDAKNAEYESHNATVVTGVTLDDYLADTNLTVNMFRYIGGYLYRITSNIASGESIIPGVNAQQTTICDVLTSILNS